MNIQEISYTDHDEWLEIRKHYIGGSDAGADERERRGACQPDGLPRRGEDLRPATNY